MTTPDVNDGLLSEVDHNCPSSSNHMCSNVEPPNWSTSKDGGNYYRSVVSVPTVLEMRSLQHHLARGPLSKLTVMVGCPRKLNSQNNENGDSEDNPPSHSIPQHRHDDGKMPPFSCNNVGCEVIEFNLEGSGVERLFQPLK